MTLNEANTRKQLIDRALESVGWKDEYLNCEYEKSNIYMFYKHNTRLN